LAGFVRVSSRGLSTRTGFVLVSLQASALGWFRSGKPAGLSTQTGFVRVSTQASALGLVRSSGKPAGLSSRAGFVLVSPQASALGAGFVLVSPQASALGAGFVLVSSRGLQHSGWNLDKVQHPSKAPDLPLLPSPMEEVARLAIVELLALRAIAAVLPDSWCSDKCRVDKCRVVKR
jgi:hypothetical protein